LALLAVIGAASHAAPVVVTPGALSGYAFYPPGVGGGGTPNGMQQTLQTCFVEFSRDDRTLLMSTRNWFSTTSVTVFYKMVGGGAGVTIGPPGSMVTQPQLQSAGGSSVLLKNGSLVAAANGMDGGQASISSPPTPGTVVAGQFTLTPSDTLRVAVGGGAGSGMVVSTYWGPWYYMALPGGGGSGWEGGGSGLSTGWSTTSPTPSAGVAKGGTGTTGGAGSGYGGAGYGGTNGSGTTGGNGNADGASTSIGTWTGYNSMSYSFGGGGGRGRFGQAAGDQNGGWTCPQSPMQTYSPSQPTSFALDPYSGTAGFYFYWADPASNSHNCYAGGGRGQVVFQYQAPTCDLIPNWNQN